MKPLPSLLAIAALLGVFFACGCTSSVTTTVPAATPTPYEVLTPPGNTLAGTWTGTMAGYDEGTGFTDYGNRTMTMVVTGQQGRIFSGHMLLVFNGTEVSVPLAGIMSTDGKTFVLTEKDNGYTSGTFISAGEIELDWLRDSPAYGAAIDTLHRV